MEFITYNQLQNLITSQEKLNEKFLNGWRKKLSRAQYATALVCEFSEFLESSPRFHNHKFWKSYLQNDEQNARVEIVDMLHFGLTRIIQEYDFLKTSKRYEDIDFNEFVKLVHTSFIKRDKEATKQGKVITLEDIISFCKDAMEIPTDTSRSIDCSSDILYFIRELCRYYNMSGQELFDGYFLKNKLNVTRVENGYTTGTYQKVVNGVEDNRSLSI